MLPSVMVGDIAGILNGMAAAFRAVCEKKSSAKVSERQTEGDSLCILGRTDVCHPLRGNWQPTFTNRLMGVRQTTRFWLGQKQSDWSIINPSPKIGTAQNFEPDHSLRADNSDRNTQN
jgi:hypothetical protein